MLVSDAQVLTDVAAALKQRDAATLLSKAPWWKAAVQLPHLAAYNEIVGTLTARGYTLAQITAWDRGPEFERAFALYYALLENSVLSEAGKGVIEKYERYQKLIQHVSVTASGAITDPAGTAGQPLTGAYNTGNDLFVFDPSDDPRSGMPSVF